MWTCIALTCSDPLWAEALREELGLLQKQDLLESCLQCIVLEDPVGTVGSGGATLNALLVIVERLSHLKGHTTVTSDVLRDSHILIIHQGRETCYWPNTKGFLPTWKAKRSRSGLETHLERIVHLCSNLKEGAAPGLWIASTDLFLYGELKDCYDWSKDTPDALLLTLHSTIEEAKYSGIVKCDDHNIVQSISFKKDRDDTVTVVGGVVFLRTSVAETLLALYTRPPLDRCTYLGVDNGEQPLNLSLYFDVLAPLCKGVDKDDFLSGSYGSSYNETFGITNHDKKSKIRARNLLWDQLNGFNLRAFPVTNLRHCYWTDHHPLERILLTSDLYHTCTEEPNVVHSFIANKKHYGSKLICINSSIQAELQGSKEIMIISSQINCTKSQAIHFCGRAYVINMCLNLDELPPSSLCENCAMVGYWIRVDKQLKMGVSLFSAVDIPTLPIEHPEATIFGFKWVDYMSLKGIQTNDLWGENEPCKSLMTAKMFPIAEDMTSWRNLLWLQVIFSDIGQTQEPSRLRSWRNSQRFSMHDWILLRDPLASLRQMRSAAALALTQSLPQWQSSLQPYFRRACAEDWIQSMLTALDQACAASENSSKAARLLAAIADLLACAAGNEAGLRSGPANNQEWAPSFDLLEYVSLEEGVMSLARQRCKWMDTGERLVRAARHYERAVHILISNTVKSVCSKMAVCRPFAPSRPQIGTWIDADCPARIDLSGGWSDTPPICFEMGGSVVNVAVCIDGKKPIGARARRIEKFELVLVSEDQHDPIVITSLQDILNYTNPTAPAALLKATLVCAGLVKQSSTQNLQQQLEQKLASGLELHSWSLLPKGSGLGTSSILAGALLAVVYTAMGVQFNRIELVNAVLYIEQLLTTGGGWQDQVGGLMGGFNRGHSAASTDVQVSVEPIPVTEQILGVFNEHLLLLHTGKVRLARNLLQNVIRQWYAGDESIVNCFRELLDNSYDCDSALRQGDLISLGRCIDSYWSQKKVIAPGCQPYLVEELMRCMHPLVYGQSLTGAGGGGFYFALLKQPSHVGRIRDIIASIEGVEKITFHSATVDKSGISVTVGGHALNIS